MTTRYIDSTHRSKAFRKINEAEFCDRMESLDAVGRIRASYRAFGGRILITTSGGRNSAVMLHLAATAIGMEFPVVFVDHLFHTDDTYAMVTRLQDAGYDVHIYRSAYAPNEIYRRYPGWDVPSSEHFSTVVRLIKQEPLNRAFADLRPTAWLRGIMRYETNERKGARFVEFRNGVFQVHPILDWDRDRLSIYIREHELPVNNGHWDITKGNDQTLECRIGERCGTKL